MIKIIIHDGRESRDQSKVDSEGLGEVLAVVENAKQPLNLGDAIALKDGTRVLVIGYTEDIQPDGLTQHVSIGSLPERQPSHTN